MKPHELSTFDASFLWEGIEYNSLENCLVASSEGKVDIDSRIIGYYEEKIFRVDYAVKANADWETLAADVDVVIDGKRFHVILEGDGKGSWTCDSKPSTEFQGCVDIDISLTPLTNTLPVRRLNLAIDETKQFRVLYLDVLNKTVKPVVQKYTRVARNSYRFENVPNDFEAVIDVDDDGFVVTYPELFIRRSNRGI